MLAAFAVALGHAPKEVEDLMAAPRVPESPPDPEKATVRNAEDIEVEIPKPAPTVISVPHAMQAILKAKHPNLNRKQRRQLAHRLQANATKQRRG
jgi:hypothetical protein